MDLKVVANEQLFPWNTVNKQKILHGRSGKYGIKPIYRCPVQDHRSESLEIIIALRVRKQTPN